MAHNTPKTRSTEAAQPLRPAQRTNSITRCFIAMRKSSLNFSAGRASGVILPMIAVLLCCSVMLSNSAVKAQCPSQIGGCPAWSTATITTSTDGTPLNGADSALCAGSSPTVCCVTIGFCYVCCDGVINVVLNSVAPNSHCTLSPDQLIDFADWYAGDWAVEEYMGGGGGCDVKQSTSWCPNSSVEVQVFTQDCWKNILAGDVYEACPLSCECRTTFHVCWNPVTMQLIYSDYNTTVNGTCTCLAEPATWIPGTCYQIACPDGMGGHE